MVRCRKCIHLKPEKNPAVSKFIRRQVILLRHGCWCDNQFRYWTIGKIAEAMSLHVNTVHSILRRWKEQEFCLDLDKRKFNKRSYKLSADQLREILSR